MALRTSNPDKVRNFLRNRKPHPFCDLCVADECKLGNQIFSGHYNRTIAQQITKALATERQAFRRSKGLCAKCSKNSVFVTNAK